MKSEIYKKRLLRRLAPFQPLRGGDINIEIAETLIAADQADAHPLALPEQPFDSLLLRTSPLYLTSRKLYLKQKGVFEPQLLSMARSLASPILLEPKIAYSPLMTELVSVIQSQEVQDQRRFFEYVTNVFHEQNHRILWSFFPKPPRTPAALYIYMALAESLVVALEYTLGTDLGSPLIDAFAQTGVLYSKPETVHQRLSSPLNLDLFTALSLAYLFNICQISEPQITATLQERLTFESDAVRVAERIGQRLDRQFITMTTLLWFRKHHKIIAKQLKTGGRSRFPEVDHALDERVLRLAKNLALKTWTTYGLSKLSVVMSV